MTGSKPSLAARTLGAGRLGWGVLTVMGVVSTLSACGTSVTETYVNGPPGTVAARSPRSVRIYASGPPAQPHRDVAIMEVEQTRGLNQQGTGLMIDRLRNRAAQLGCDGVVIGGMRERDGFSPESGLYLLDPGAKTLHGTCIVFIDTTPAGTLAAPQSPPAKELPATKAAATATDSIPQLDGEGSCRAP